MTLETVQFELFAESDKMCMYPILTMKPNEIECAIEITMHDIAREAMQETCTLNEEDCKGMVEWLCSVHGWKVIFDE